MRYSVFCRGLAVCVIVAASAFPLAFAADPAGGKPNKLMGIAKPSKDVTLSFVRPGRVRDIVVHEGDEVKAKQLVAAQDDDEEKAALEIDQTKADDKTSIEAEQTVRDQKAKDVQKYKQTPGAVGQIELEAAELEVKVADARIKLAESQHVQDQLKAKQTGIAVDKLKLSSPIDGVIAQTFLSEGESADGGNMRVVRVVQLDPLWVEVPVPFSDAQKIKKADLAAVTFPDKKARQGKVILIFPVGDAGSQTLSVRIEVPNPEKIPAGEIVNVDFNLPPSVAQK